MSSGLSETTERAPEIVSDAIRIALTEARSEMQRTNTPEFAVSNRVLFDAEARTNSVQDEANSWRDYRSVGTDDIDSSNGEWRPAATGSVIDRTYNPRSRRVTPYQARQPPRQPSTADPLTIAICMPSTSRGLGSLDSLSSLPFFTTLLPSVLSTTAEQKSGLIAYHFYLGFDSGDRVYDRDPAVMEIRDRFREMVAKAGRPDWTLTLLRLHGTDHAPAWAWYLSMT